MITINIIIEEDNYSYELSTIITKDQFDEIIKLNLFPLLKAQEEQPI